MSSRWPRQSRPQAGRRRSVSPSDITYVLGALFLRGLRTIPPTKRTQAIDRVSPLLARLAYAANVHRTRRIRENVSVVFGSHGTPEVGRADIQRLLSLSVWNGLITNTLPTLTRQQLVELVPIEGTNYLDDYLASGHPVLIWCYHHGISPVVVAALLNARGYPIHLIGNVHRTPATANALRSHYYRHLERADTELVKQFPMIDPMDGVQRKVLDVLKNKECLCITPDRMIPEHRVHPKLAFEVPVDFLGRRAYLQTGGLRLAKRLGARVVSVLSAQANGRHRQLVIEPFELPTPGLTPAELQQDLQMCMRGLEDAVLAHPDWWLDLRRDDLTHRLGEPHTGPERE